MPLPGYLPSGVEPPVLVRGDLAVERVGVHLLPGVRQHDGVLLGAVDRRTGLV